MIPEATPQSDRPEPDGLADAGEIVWTWVPFKDPTQGRAVPPGGGHKGNVLRPDALSQGPTWEADDWLLLGSDRGIGPDGSLHRLDRLFNWKARDPPGRRVVDRAFWRVAAVLRDRYGWT